MKEKTHLTILKTSIFFAGDGFTVYNSDRQLVFRVDSCQPHFRQKDDIVLMDPHGRSVQRGRVCIDGGKDSKGTENDGDKPIFSARRSSLIGRSRTSVAVEVYDKPGEEYQIEGCFSQRSCTVFNATKESVAEIRLKVDPTTSVMLGKEVLSLCVEAGFDGAFAMGSVLILVGSTVMITLIVGQKLRCTLPQRIGDSVHVNVKAFGWFGGLRLN